MSWMLLTLLYGVVKGFREIVKKKSLEKSTVVEVLFFYSLFGFLILIPDIPNVGGVDAIRMIYIIIKAFIIFVAWLASFHAIKKIPISLYGILDLSRVLFATLLGVVVAGEVLKLTQIAGLVLVAFGLLMLKFKKGNQEQEDVRMVYVIFAFLSCLLNAVSGLMDKLLTRDGYITPGQLQFWYMLYLVIFYFIYMIGEAFIKGYRTAKSDNTKMGLKWITHIADFKGAVTNYWIWILSILFIIADRALFIANANPDSRITVMTLIKQAGCIVTIVAGKVLFKEKNIRYKFLCAFIIILGIFIGVL